MDTLLNQEICDPKSGRTCRYVPLNTNYRYAAVSQDMKLLAITENINTSGDYQYGYIRFYDLKNPEDPQLVGQEKLTESMSGIPGRIVIDNNLAYISTSGIGLQVVDIDAAMTRNRNGEPIDGSCIVGFFDTKVEGMGSPVTFIPYKKGIGVMTVTTGELVTVDLSTPQQPSLILKYQPEDNSNSSSKSKYLFTSLSVIPEYSFMNSDNGKIEIIDLAISGSISGKISTIDISDPANPKIIGTVAKSPTNNLPELIYTRDITINPAEGVAIATSYNAIHIIDIRDPYHPRILNSNTTLPGGENSNTKIDVPLGSTSALTELDGWVYLANQASGMKSVNIGGEEPKPCTLACGCCGK